MSEFDKTELENEEILDQIDEEVLDLEEAATVTLGGKQHPSNKIPIEHHAEFKKKYPGVRTRLRGPRVGPEHRYGARDTLKKNATHFYAPAEAIKESFLEEDNAATIAGNPTDVSRSELMSMMVNYANSLGNKEELAAFVAKLPNAKEMTRSNDEIYNSVSGNATKDDGANKASIKSSGAPSEPMKALPSMKEDLAVLFGDDSGLSEDFRIKTETIFEAAVATRVGLELARLEESYEAKLEESVSAIQQEMEENVDAYLNYAVAEWMQENKLAIESNIRTEIMESFLGGLKDLFTEHHIDIPEDDVPVVEAMAAEIEALEEQINETTEKNIELQKALAEAEVLKAADELSEGMTDTQKDKFVKLVEAINYTSAEEFRKKASVIKETYFSGKTEVKAQQDQLLNETVDEPEAEKFVAPDMRMYVESLSRSIKK